MIVEKITKNAIAREFVQQPLYYIVDKRLSVI